VTHLAPTEEKTPSVRILPDKSLSTRLGKFNLPHWSTEQNGGRLKRALRMLLAFSIAGCCLAAQHEQHRLKNTEKQPSGTVDHSMPEGHHHDTSMTSEPWIQRGRQSYLPTRRKASSTIIWQVSS